MKLQDRIELYARGMSVFIPKKQKKLDDFFISNIPGATTFFIKKIYDEQMSLPENREKEKKDNKRILAIGIINDLGKLIIYSAIGYVLISPIISYLKD